MQITKNCIGYGVWGSRLFHYEAKGRMKTEMTSSGTCISSCILIRKEANILVIFMQLQVVMKKRLVVFFMYAFSVQISTWTRTEQYGFLYSQFDYVAMMFIWLDPASHCSIKSVLRLCCCFFLFPFLIPLNHYAALDSCLIDCFKAFTFHHTRCHSNR